MCVPTSKFHSYNVFYILLRATRWHVRDLIDEDMYGTVFVLGKDILLGYFGWVCNVSPSSGKKRKESRPREHMFDYI